MDVQQWNFLSREYEPVTFPDDRVPVLYVEDLNTVIDCAGCARRVTAGDCFTSLVLHNSTGFGYMVCEQCYERETAMKAEYEQAVEQIKSDVERGIVKGSLEGKPNEPDNH
jgi:hypothetical protein